MQNQKDTYRKDEDKNTSTRQGGNRNTFQQTQQNSDSQRQQGQENWDYAQLSNTQQAGNKNIHQQAQQNITSPEQEYQTTDLEATEDDTSRDRNTKLMRTTMFHLRIRYTTDISFDRNYQLPYKRGFQLSIIGSLFCMHYSILD